MDWITLERDGYAAGVQPLRGPREEWVAVVAWIADVGLQFEGQSALAGDRDQAICAGVRLLLASLDAADPLRRSPAVTAVARARMQKIRDWAESVAEKHRPMAMAVSLFGEGA